MAGQLTGTELAAARKELEETNRKFGFPRRDTDGGPQDSPAIEGTAPAEPKAQDVGISADPGPPRFIGVDLERKLAGLSGGGAIPLTDEACGEIVDTLLTQLRLHMRTSVGTIAASHGRQVDPAQLAIEFPDESGKA